MMEDVGEQAWQPVESLEGGGVSTADLKKLKERGFHTVESIAYATKKELTEIKGISDQKVEKLHLAAHKVVRMGFSTATRRRSTSCCRAAARPAPSRRSMASSARERLSYATRSA